MTTSTTVRPVGHAQLSSQVAAYLRQKILSGEIPAGTWLRQHHLARSLGVSAIPVREAFKMLAAEGLVEHLPYRGIRVLRLSGDELEDLYAIRAFAEARAASFAAQVISPGELAELEELAVAMEECTEPETLPRYRELNRQFHTRLAEFSRRPYLVRLLKQLWTAYPTMLWANYPGVAVASLPTRETTDNTEHQRILAALRAHDSRQAAHEVAHHIRRAGHALVCYVRGQEQRNSGAAERKEAQLPAGRRLRRGNPEKGETP